jgi:hypothetical protein
MSDWTPLPVPFENVRISYYANESLVGYECVGMPVALIASGAAEPQMMERGRPGTARLDSRGDHFGVKSRVKYGPHAGRIHIYRCPSTLARARLLPGIAEEDLPTHFISMFNTSPSRVHTCPLWYNRAQQVHCGTREALIRSGLLSADDARIIDKKPRPPGHSKYLGEERGWLHWTLDGYFGVHDQKKATMARPQVSHLRLVVDNDPRELRPS